jgi:hypothetical protein
VLYDLKNSPVETNLAVQQPTIIARLKKSKVREWNKLLVVPQRPGKTQSYEMYDGVLLLLFD